MKGPKIVILMVLSFGFVLGIAGIESVYASQDTMGCPENYYNAEFGCQFMPETEYVTETGEEVAALTGCPEGYYNSEFGCQFPVYPEYSPEYALVGERSEDGFGRGCDSAYFDPEKGCQY